MQGWLSGCSVSESIIYRPQDVVGRLKDTRTMLINQNKSRDFPYITVILFKQSLFSRRMTVVLIRFIANVLWFFLGGGVFIALGYLLGGLALCLTIIGIPLGIQTLKLARVGVAPFGLDIVEIPGRNGSINFIMNIIWLIFGGIWIVITHIVFGIGAAFTIIGIPFAIQHLKLAELSLTPFGKRIVG